MDAYHKQMLDLVKAALDEDIGTGDITSLACLETGRIKAEISAKSEGILSGIEPTVVAFRLVDNATDVKIWKNDGDRFSPGDKIALVEGFNQPVMTGERAALNFLGHLSGIATLTGKFAAKLAGTDCKILDTRKTTPGFRLLEKKAVVHGGGTNHRIGLFDMILIKDNHILTVGSITRAVELTQEYLHSPHCRQQFGKGPDEIGIEVEVSTEDQLVEAINAGVPRLLLDNQSIESLKALVDKARAMNPKVILEASGNVTLDNIAEIAATGVNFVSSGAITHSAPDSDFSMRVVSTD
jgi:nicotinate-nucleotide pyrophosphorylase (carboxylating)